MKLNKDEAQLIVSVVASPCKCPGTTSLSSSLEFLLSSASVADVRRSSVSVVETVVSGRRRRGRRTVEFLFTDSTVGVSTVVGFSISAATSVVWKSSCVLIVSSYAAIGDDDVIFVVDDDVISADSNVISAENDVISADKVAISVDGDVISIDGDVIFADSNVISAENDIISDDKVAVSVDGDVISADKDVFSADKDVISVDGDVISIGGDVIIAFVT